MPQQIIVVGTKPPRPHVVANQTRAEIWTNDKGAKCPVIRLRDDHTGAIAIMEFEEFVKFRDNLTAVIEALEKDAGSIASAALDSIVKNFKPKEGNSDVE